MTALPVLAAEGSDEPMRDPWGRRIEYLRISVTDKCNLRCVYCMPEKGMEWLKRDEILDYEEIADIVRLMAGMGLRRVRITGGEPLVRKDLPRLVEMIDRVPQIEDLSLSTNAVLLAPMAEELRDAGVDRVNISLDSFGGCGPSASWSRWRGPRATDRPPTTASRARPAPWASSPR